MTDHLPAQPAGPDFTGPGPGATQPERAQPSEQAPTTDAPNPMPPNPVEHRRGPSWWVWLIIAAVVIVGGSALAVFGGSSDGPVVPGVLPKGLPPAVPHGGEGSFLSSAYAEGAHEYAVKGSNAEFVGASPDSNIIAINVDHEIRGIAAGSSQEMWTFPSYACSEGSWEGVALCVDSDEYTEASLGEIYDLVGLDLATGKPTFRFTPNGVPRRMNFIGTDDAHAYFTVELWSTVDVGVWANHVLALTNDGEVAWMTGVGDSVVFSAALVADDQLAVADDETVLVLDRATGGVALEHAVEEWELSMGPKLLWDGWRVYAYGDDQSDKVYDLTGELVGEYRYLQSFLPSDFVSTRASRTVFERAVLTVDQKGGSYPWAVTRDGERVLGDDGLGIIDSQGRYVVKNATLWGSSADGSLLFSDVGRGAIHDSGTGSVLGKFTESGMGGWPTIVDGIVFRDGSAGNDLHEVEVLLPGPG